MPDPEEILKVGVLVVVVIIVVCVIWQAIDPAGYKDLQGPAEVLIDAMRLSQLPT